MLVMAWLDSMTRLESQWMTRDSSRSHFYKIVKSSWCPPLLLWHNRKGLASLYHMVQNRVVGLDIESLTKSPMVDCVSYFNLGAWHFVWRGLSPPKPPWWRDWYDQSAFQFYLYATRNVFTYCCVKVFLMSSALSFCWLITRVVSWINNTCECLKHMLLVSRLLSCQLWLYFSYQ